MLNATVFSLLSPQSTEQAFGFAIDLGLKSLALGAAALLLDRALGRRVLARSAALHACLLGLLLLPIAGMMLPHLKLNLIGEQAPSEGSPFTPRKDSVSPSETRQYAETKPPAAASPELAPARLSPFAPRKGAVSPSETRQRAETPPAAAPVARRVDWRAVVLLSYAAVAFAALLRLSRSLLAVASLKRSGSPLMKQAWTERLAHWQARLGVARPVALLASDRVDVPVVIGWRRPVILAPERLTAADPKTIDAILLHELAHVRRADYAWNLLLRLLQAIYWPNLLLWLVGRSLSRVREQACDEVCIHWLGGAEGYRATLVELAGSLLRRPLAALGMAMAGASRLQRRLQQIDSSRGRAECQPRLPWRFAALAVVVSSAGALGALKITSRAAAEPPERVNIVIDKNKRRSDESQARQDRDGAVLAAVQETPSRKENPEPSAPAALRAESPQAAEKPEKAEPANTPKQDASKPAADEPIKVRVEQVRREDFVVQTSQMGTLKSSRSVELYARVAGLIVARHVNVGDVVKAGQVLAEIEAPELDAELELARTAAEEAPAVVEQAQGKLDEASAGLEGAQARVVKSEAELSRAMRNRNREESIPVAKAQIAAANAEVKQAEAAVTVAKAGLRIAELQLGAGQQAYKRVHQRAMFRQVKAPANGVVVRQAAEPGSLAKLGGEPLFVISGTNVLTMQSQIPERDALRVAPGQHAQIWFDAERDGQPRDSKVARVGYVIDPKTRTMSVEIELDNSDGRLRPGMNGRVAIDLETHPGVLTTGRMSVFWVNQGSARPRYCCYRVVDGRAVKTPVVPAENNDTRQEIKSGVKEGDVVVAALENGLEDGVRVEIVDDDK